MMRGLLQCTTLLAEFAEPSGNDDGASRPALREITDQRRHRLGWRDHDREVRCVRQAGDSWIDA